MGGASRGTSSRGGGGWESEIEIDMLQVRGAGLLHYAALHIELQTVLFPTTLWFCTVTRRSGGWGEGNGVYTFCVAMPLNT